MAKRKASKKVKKAYRIMLLGVTGEDIGWSIDMPKVYRTRAGAQKAIKKHGQEFNYRIQEIE